MNIFEAVKDSVTTTSADGSAGRKGGQSSLQN